MTDPAADLRDLVTQLARRHDVRVIMNGEFKGIRKQRPLLEIIAAASAPTITTAGRGGTLGPRLAFDPAASDLHASIRARIRRWAYDAEVPRHWVLAGGQPIDWTDTAQLLLAWHARTLHTDPLRWIPTLAGWTGAIVDLITDPPLRRQIDAPCPRCHRRSVLIGDPRRPDTRARIDALEVFLRDPATDSEALCHGCDTTWLGIVGLELLQDELHAAEHATHGIACAGETQLGSLGDLAVTIPTLDREQSAA